MIRTWQSDVGLPDNTVVGIEQKPDGFLWVATQTGLVRFDGLQFRQFAQAAVTGAPANLFQASHGFRPGALRGPDGNLWFAMESGMAEVSAGYLKDNPQAPNVVLERVSANGKTVAAFGAEESLTDPGAAVPRELCGSAPRLRLLPGKRQLEFTFTALSVRLPESIGFKYRLHGLDKDWVEAGSRRVASHPQVPPGHYRFQVLACNSDGVWNETGATVDLTVEPNWWETAWFRVLAPLCAIGLLGGGLLWVLRRRHHRQVERLKMQQATERERVRIARDLHDDLGAELSSIAMLSDMVQHDAGENQAVRSRLGEIITHARQTILRLEEIVWAGNPANDSVEHFATYLCKFAQRYLELAGVRSRFDVPDRFAPRPLTSAQRHNLFLAAKEALHNAARHGMPAEVTVRIALCDECISVTVADGGVGCTDMAALTGVRRSANMAARMTQIGGTFERHSVPGQGTEVVLAINLTKTLA